MTSATTPDLTNEEYHADFDHIGHTMLERFRKSPAWYRAIYVTKTKPPPEPTAAQFLGTLTHTLVLEPATWDQRYLTAPAGLDRRSKKKWAELEAQAGSRTIIKVGEEAQARAMADAVLADSIAARLFAAKGPIEQTIHWTDPVTKLALKSRIDKRVDTPSANWLVAVDLKTATDPRRKAFERDAYNLGYHRQAAHYIDSLHVISRKPCRFVFAVVGSTFPHDVYKYQCDDLFMTLGQNENREDLRSLAQAYETDVWMTSEQSQLNLLSPPRWAIERREL